ncbi:MAG TPA: sensor domain-containing diguanylate cyclase [Bacteroidota bacterium]
MSDDGLTKTLLRTVSPVDGLMIVVGLLVLVTGILVDAVVAKVFSGVIVAAAAAYVTFSIRAKITRQEAQEVKHSSDLFTNSQKKKLLFDDFQPESGPKLVVDDSAVGASSDRSSALARGGLGKGIADRAPGRTSTVARVREFQASDFFDVNSELFKGETEPRAEFDFLLSKVLSVAKEVLFAHTVAFFWANNDKQQMVLEAKVTDGQLFMAGRRFNMGGDIVSQVANSGKPEVINRINPLSEKEMVAYYSNVSYVRSFVAVPVFFSDSQGGKTPVAVLAVDSKVEDAFGQETVVLLGNFTKLISALLKSYTDKYDLLLDSEVLNAVRRLQQAFLGERTTESLLGALVEESSRLIYSDYLAVVRYDDGRKVWVVGKVLNRDQDEFLPEGDAVDFPESLVGSVIRSNSYELVNDLPSYAGTLFSKNEQRGRYGSVIILPISSINKCYGALCVLSKDRHNYAHREVRLLSRLVDTAASSFEILGLTDLVNEHVAVDEHTGLLDRKHFLGEVAKELQRSDDFGTDCTFVSVSLDDYKELAERYGKEGFESILYTIARVIQSGVRPYDITGLLDPQHIGVVLAHTAANDAYIWAEKVRESISSRIFTVDNRTFSVTVSVGICGATEGMGVEEFIGNAMEVLKSVAEKGGNLVRVY